MAAAVGIALLAPTFLGAGRPEDPISRIDRLEALARQRGLRGDELVELGVARFEVGRSDEAEHALRAAAIRALEVGRSDWAALAYHDLGVIALERGDREAARDHFFEAVALAPDASRSRYNLEWTLRSLAVPEAPPTPSPTGTTPDEDDPRRQPEPEADADGSEAEEDPGPAVETPRPDPPDDPSTEPQRAELTTEAGTQPTGSPADAPPPPRLDAEQAARWLERVDDDPSRALRSAAERDRSERRRRRSQQAW